MACRRSAPKAELVRFVRAAEGSVVRDASGHTPGRGAYVCSERSCFDQAVKRSKLGRALRAEIGPAEYERLRREFGG